jgi:hypothetical protein
VALLCGAAAGFPKGALSGWRPGVTLGLAALAVGFLWFGVPWGMSWLNLLPNLRRALVGLVLFPLMLPWCLLLASGYRQLLGHDSQRDWVTLVRGLAWLILPLTLWFSYRYLAVAHCVLFLIPVALLAVGFVLPLPLWFLPERRGMAVARAVCHAGATAWLLACHLPFVHGVY